MSTSPTRVLVLEDVNLYVLQTMYISGNKLGSKRLGEALFWTKIIEKHRKTTLNIEKRASRSELCLRVSN